MSQIIFSEKIEFLDWPELDIYKYLENKPNVQYFLLQHMNYLCELRHAYARLSFIIIPNAIEITVKDSLIPPLFSECWTNYELKNTFFLKQ